MDCGLNLRRHFLFSLHLQSLVNEHISAPRNTHKKIMGLCIYLSQDSGASLSRICGKYQDLSLRHRTQGWQMMHFQI